MIFGGGVDIEEYSRFKKHLKNFDSSHFVQLVLSESEISNFLMFSPELCLPIAFCCKEAIFKALGESWTISPIDWKEIQIIFSEKPVHKKYRIELSGYAGMLYKKLNISEICSNYNIFDDHVVFEVILHNERL